MTQRMELPLRVSWSRFMGFLSLTVILTFCRKVFIFMSTPWIDPTTMVPFFNYIVTVSFFNFIRNRTSFIPCPDLCVYFIRAHLIYNLATLRPITGRMRPQLRLPDRQAYEGAKSFYMCFLPTTIAVLCAALAYVSPADLLRAPVMVATYLAALKFYRLCNSIDIRVNPFTRQDVESTGQWGSHDLNTTQMGQKGQQKQPVRAEVQDRPPRLVCKVCHIVLPYRSRHCEKCQCCVERYDHHCFWIGSCVGYNNHRQFYVFLILQTVNSSCVLSTCLVLHGFADELWPSLLLYATEGVSIGFICFTGYLGLYHSMLMATGMTTWEHMARPRITYLKYLKPGINPFSKGLVSNIKQFWARPHQPVDYLIPSYEQARNMGPSCNLIQNQYYSCC